MVNIWPPRRLTDSSGQPGKRKQGVAALGAYLDDRPAGYRTVDVVLKRARKFVE